MPLRQKKTVTLVLGGARSGKSHYAQSLATAFPRVIYMATARRSDAELRAKIARHRRERPSAWKTLEVTTGLDRVLREKCGQADLVLIDCLTFYLANVMGWKRGEPRAVSSHLQSVCKAIRAAGASVVIVSNEVGSGVVPAYRSGREFRDLLGQFNQLLAQIADRVILMVAGLPLTVKEVERARNTPSRKRKT